MKKYEVACYCGDTISTRSVWRAGRFARRHGVACSKPYLWLERARGEQSLRLNIRRQEVSR